MPGMVEVGMKELKKTRVCSLNNEKLVQLLHLPSSALPAEETGMTKAWTQVTRLTRLRTLLLKISRPAG